MTSSANSSAAWKRRSTCCSPQGRLVVVSFHSLEDRIVKQFLAARFERAPRASRHAPEQRARAADVQASDATVRACPARRSLPRNPRARSAKLRVAERTAAALAA